ncbi:hypothetical protein D9619_008419 [Psilocybe cf. subviscida]|uniref:Uncharacterized protein n=1 Tax=Psilocybe cf. subviscida TaxID=2480587 RepID=A0A8H5BAJ1_9AGAR|nr:hypothetical protein D9619_008419 [Psilocybe cf. subviscida]
MDFMAKEPTQPFRSAGPTGEMGAAYAVLLAPESFTKLETDALCSGERGVLVVDGRRVYVVRCCARGPSLTALESSALRKLNTGEMAQQTGV